MMAKNLTHAAFGARAFYRHAYRCNRGDHAYARSLNRCGRSNRIHLNESRAPIPPEGKSAAILTASLLARFAEIALPPQMLLGTETHGVRRDAKIAGSELVSNNRQALTAFATAGSKNFTATTGGFAGAIADLTGALFAMWVKCRLHVSKTKKG